MDARELMIDVHSRVRPLVEEALEGLTPVQLTWAPQAGANTIAWLVWHLTKVQDYYVAEYSGTNEVVGEYAERLGRTTGLEMSGYGDTAEQVLSVRPESAAVLVDYHAAVQERLLAYLDTLTEADLDRVIDESYDPPVTLGVRLVSVADDCLQHAGQAAYLRGLLP